MLKFRLHQEEMDSFCNEIKAGQLECKKILAYVTPGGGKSMLPVLVAKHLLPRLAEKICWVVPRLALKRQAAMSFEKSKTTIIHNHRIQEADNLPNPSKGTSGYSVTYQGIGENPELHVCEFSIRDYILVLDEPHHLGMDRPWTDPVSRLVEQAKLVILMSGTLERSDRKPIAFIPYNGRYPDLTQTSELRIIKYSRKEALQEGAIVPIEFEHIDAKAEWTDSGGNLKRRDSFNDATKEEVRGMIGTALRTEYASVLLEKATKKWMAFRRNHSWSRFLIVTYDIETAKEQLAEVQKLAVGYSVEIATYNEPKAAVKAIKDYQEGRIDILITVQMAYEGLDVPEISHIACLTMIRARAWLEQMFARAVRALPGTDKDKAFCFTPDDPMMMKVIKEIEAEQIAALAQEKEGGGGSEPGPGIIPHRSDVSGRRATSLGENHKEILTKGKMAYLQTRYADVVDSCSLGSVAEMLSDLGANIPEIVTETAVISTPKDEEKDLRDAIESKAGEIAWKWYGGDYEKVNSIIKRRHGARGTAPLKDLRKMWDLVNHWQERVRS